MEHFAGTKQLFASGKASARRDSQFSTHCQGDAHTRMGQRRHFPEKQTCLTTVYAAHVPLGFLFLNDRNRETTPSYSKEKKKTTLPWNRGHVLPCCRLRFRKPTTAPSLCIRPCCRTATKQLFIDCGDDLLDNDLLLSSSDLLFWRSSHPDDHFFEFPSLCKNSEQTRPEPQ